MLTKFRFSLLAFLVTCGLASVAIGLSLRGVDTSELHIEIVPNAPNQTVRLNQPQAHFHVIITNTSANSINLWEEWCSWGDPNLSFDIIDSKGHVRSTIRKSGTQIFSPNFPSWREIAPGERHVVDVFLDRDEWILPFLKNSTHQGEFDLDVIARFTIRADAETKSNAIWTGTASSKPKNIKLRYFK